MKPSKYLSFFVFLFVLSFVSASGLRIINQSDTLVNKVAGENNSITIDIVNDETFSFYNVTLESNPYLYFDRIPEITAGQVMQANITLSNDESFSNNQFSLIGFYIANMGTSSNTYDINIDFNNGLSQCDFTAIKGDAVVFHNLVADSIVMRNSITFNDIVTIQQDQNYSMLMDYPQTLSYYFLRRGYIFTQDCTITVLDTEGLVSNPEYNGAFNLSSNVLYNPTTLSWTTPVSSYNIEVFQSEDGVMAITNTGNLTARNISFTGDWFTFSDNNFDIESGDTKAISYTISPMVFETALTNQSYTKTVNLSGNFETMSQDFTIFVPFLDVNNINNVTSYGSLIDMIMIYCQGHPDENFCKTNTQYIYVYGGNNSEVSINFTEEMARGIFDMMFTGFDNDKTYRLEDSEWKYNMSQWMSKQDSRQDYLEGYINQTQSEKTNSDTFTTFSLLSVIFVLVVCLMISLIYTYKKKRLVQETKRW